MSTRLDKFICHATGLSRQPVQRLVRNGAVLVNGAVVIRPDQKIIESDIVRLDGEIIALPSPRYFMLHKPAGYVCANSDSEHPVVLDLLHDQTKSGLQIAGRLDIDTTGLVLITDDGIWNHKVTSPAASCAKTYRIVLHEALSDIAADALRAGVLLHGEKKPTQAADVQFVDDSRVGILLTIHEGKYHQVKRMLAAVGNHVVALHRECIGGIVLDTSLAPGQYRALSQAEVVSI